MGIVHLTGAARDGFATVMPGKLWRFDGTAAVTRCSAGWPGTPGMFTDATIPKVRGFLDGVEVPIAVQALRGKHPDGSYRSIGVQVNAVASTLKRAFRLEVWSTARSVGNTLTWIEPTYGLPDEEDATDWPAVSYNAVVACTDPEHLCNSYVALQPLQPTDDDGATSAAMFGVENGSEMDAWVTYIDGLTPSALADSTYEHVHALQTAYLRSGSLAMYERHHEWLRVQIAGSYYAVDSLHPSYDILEEVDPTLPASDSNGDGVGGGAEQHLNIYFGWATGYLLSGWKQPWRRVCHGVSANANAATYTMDTNLPRFEMMRTAIPLLVGYCIEASMQVAGGYGAGRDPSTRLFATQMPAIIDEVEANAYDDFLSGFMDGFVGMKQTGADSGLPPVFQALFPARLYAFYYANVSPDTRIPPRMKAIADIVIRQATVSGDEAYWPYVFVDDEGSPPPAAGNTDPFWQGFFTELFGWMYAYETNETDKAEYLQFLNKAMDGAQYDAFTKNLKAFGEYFGAMQCGSYYRDGGTVRGVTGAHPTSIVEPPIHTS